MFYIKGLFNFQSGIAYRVKPEVTDKRAELSQVSRSQETGPELRCDMWLEVGIVASLSVILSAVILSVRRVRDGIISSKAYKKGFALHMNIFSRLHNKAVEKHKKELFATLPFTFNNVEGDILEIGSGTGANFQFFPKGSSVIALDPNPHMESYLKSNCSKFPHIHLKRCVTGFAEEIKEVQDNSVAAVVCTLTLCSVEDVTRVLQEVKRVLKPVSSD